MKITHVTSHWNLVQTVYIDGKHVTDSKGDIDIDPMIDVLEHLGHNVSCDHKTVTPEMDDKYDGENLPQDINELEFVQ